jgi:hypothetical protein
LVGRADAVSAGTGNEDCGGQFFLTDPYQVYWNCSPLSETLRSRIVVVAQKNRQSIGNGRSRTNIAARPFAHVPRPHHRTALNPCFPISVLRFRRSIVAEFDSVDLPPRDGTNECCKNNSYSSNLKQR